MRFLLIVFALLSLGQLIAGSRYWSELEDQIKKLTNNTAFQRKWAEHLKLYNRAQEQSLSRRPEKLMFDCDLSESDQPPTSVHRLLPGDIDVVAAIGDSITAGNGILAKTLPGVFNQNRGHVFSIGGFASYDEGVITIPNILKHYNVGLYGYSTGTGFVIDNVSKFNMAIPGRTAPDLPEQAVDLVKKMKNSRFIDYATDWKMVTLFIGGNDLCRVCNDENLLPDAFKKNIITTLDTLYNQMPRTIVNLIPIFDITPLPTLSPGGVCDVVQWFECPCTEPQHRDFLIDTQFDYAEKLEEIAESGKYDGKDDFTVVYQSFTRDSIPVLLPDGSVDLSYFAPDCFHLSEKGHQSAAINYWNSLFEPVGEKQLMIDFEATLKCPAKGDFIKTNKNSDTGKKDSKSSADQSMRQRLQSLAANTHSDPSTSASPVGVVLAAVGAVCGLVAVSVAIYAVVLQRRKKKDGAAPQDF